MEAAPAALLVRARTGDRRAVARLVSIFERGGDPAAMAAGLVSGLGAAVHVIGITGAPGAGKSTLIGGMLHALVAGGRTPAVLAVDPSSSITGGAVLGDRVRLHDPGHGAYVRSMATRGRQGGLAAAVPPTIRLLAAAGFDPVIVETTGVGQAEIDIASAADTTVLVTAPGWGDAIQATKAGLLELADVLVVNKADLPGAADVRRDLELMLDLGLASGLAERTGAPRAPVVMCDAVSGAGAQDIVDALDAHHAYLAASGRLDERRARQRALEVSGLVDAQLAARIEATLASPTGTEVMRGLADARLTPADAADRIVAAIAAGLLPGG